MSRFSRRKRETVQPIILGLNLNKSRNTSILLISGSIISALILLSQFYLSKEQQSRGKNNSLGSKQSYDKAFHSTHFKSTVATSSSSTTQTASSLLDSELFDDSVWNQKGYTWNPLVADKRPITDITMRYCLSSPRIWDVCSPTATLKEEQERGKWIRVDKDLNKGIGMTFNYLYIRRLQPNSKVPVVTKVTMVDSTELTGDAEDKDPTVGDLTLGDWYEPGGDLRLGLWPKLPPLYVRYRVNTAEQIKESNGNLVAITELDIVYGGEIVAPLYGFERIEPMITGGPDDSKALGIGGLKGTSRAGTALAFRGEIPILPPIPTLEFSPKGEFKILQVADLHFSVGPGECHEMSTAHEKLCKAVGADIYSLNWMERVLNETKPDLIVLTGDMINGQGTSWDSQSSILKFAKVLWERNVPWTVIFGNHDEENDLSNEKQMELYRSFPNFIGESGPASADGVGNYLRSIHSGDAHNTSLFNLYFLDSHGYAKTLNPWTKKAAYDWLKPGQINWFRSQSSRIAPLTRPYIPPLPISPPELLYSMPSKNKQPPPSLRRLLSKKRDIPIRPNPVEIGAKVTVMPDDGAQVDDYGSLETEEEEGKFTPLDKVGVTKVSTTNTKTKISVKLADGPTKKKPMSAKPNALMFFHIPLPESYTSPIDTSLTGMNLQSGERKEGPGSPKKNSGFFENAILAQGELIDEEAKKNGIGKEEEFWEGEFTAPTKGRTEVKIVANGHCHLSEDCRRVNGVWLCFGGGGSYSGYGKANFDRRMRVYSVSEWGEKVSTYHIVDNLDEPLSKVGEIILVGEDAMGEVAVV